MLSQEAMRARAVKAVQLAMAPQSEDASPPLQPLIDATAAEANGGDGSRRGTNGGKNKKAKKRKDSVEASGSAAAAPAEETSAAPSAGGGGGGLKLGVEKAIKMFNDIFSSERQGGGKKASKSKQVRGPAAWRCRPPWMHTIDGGGAAAFAPSSRCYSLGMH